MPFDDTGGTVQALIADGGWDLVVFENFIITAATLRKGRQGSQSLELIGVGRYLAKCYSVPFETQNPSDAKTFSTDVKIRSLDWWTPGKLDHPNDASRHVLLALARHREIPPNLMKRLVDAVA